MMRKGKVSLEKAEQIKIIFQQGHSIRTISCCLKMSRKTVRKYLEQRHSCDSVILKEENQTDKIKVEKDNLPFWAQEIDIN